MVWAQPSRSLVASRIEHTLLKPEASAEDIRRLCREAVDHCFHGVCVHGCRVALAYQCLEDSEVKVIAVTGFPLGAVDSDCKRYETEAAVDNGAAEIDVVLNLGLFKDRAYKAVLRELRDVVEAADERPVKVIIETCLLSQEEKAEACRLILDSGAQFVKTSTGFSRAGATLEDIRFLRECVGPSFGVKASGGIRDAAMVLAMLQAGADRIGSSAGAPLLHGLTD